MTDFLKELGIALLGSSAVIGIFVYIIKKYIDSKFDQFQNDRAEVLKAALQKNLSEHDAKFQERYKRKSESLDVLLEKLHSLYETTLYYMRDHAFAELHGKKADWGPFGKIRDSFFETHRLWEKESINFEEPETLRFSGQLDQIKGCHTGLSMKARSPDFEDTLSAYNQFVDEILSAISLLDKIYQRHHGMPTEEGPVPEKSKG